MRLLRLLLSVVSLTYLRSQSKQKESVFTSVFDEGGKDQSVLDQLNSMRVFEKEQETEKRREEILRYNSCLREFGLSFQELYCCFT